jgi:hypothetical protein
MPPRLTTLRRLYPSVIYPKNNLRALLRGHDVVAPFPVFFSTTKRHYARSHEPTHYEILNVPVTATAAEIKKYVTHPSTHPPHDANEVEDNSTPSPSNTTPTATAPTPKQLNASPPSHQLTISSATATNAHATISIMALAALPPRERIHIPWAATVVPAQHMPDPGQRVD